jgi:Uma2 family endonuclease
MDSILPTTPIPEEQITFPTNLPYDDGEPMETPWHRSQMNLLIETLQYHWRERNDYFAGGNMFIYFSNKQVFNKDFRGPDFFVVKGVDFHRDRKSWIVWEEDGHYPDVIVELLSPSTEVIDRTEKKSLYHRIFRTPEYYCFDPDELRFEAFQRFNGEYELIPFDERGFVWSKELELNFGYWQGIYQGMNRTWLRFYDVKGTLVPLAQEAETKARQEAEIQANNETIRANTLQEELDRVRKELEALRQQQNPTST